MRKRFVLESSRIVLAALAITLFVAACDVSPADQRTSASSAGGGPAVETSAAIEGPVAEQSVPRPADGAFTGKAMGAPVNVNAANAPASAQDRALSLGVPLPATDPSGAMLIRHGQASVEVRRLDDAVTKVRQTAAQFGGFVANTSLRSGKDEQHAANLEIRVPTAQFDALLAALGGFGRVESVSATAQDVGDEYVDLGARAANARRVEARLAELLANRTGKLSEVLTVEQELARVRQEIERYDARLKWLERRTALSSLDVTLHEPLPLIERQPGPGPLAEALARAWERAVGVLAWCIASLGILVPLGLLIGAGVVVARRVLRAGTPPGVSGA
jgi:uncharacterized protein DUF4349